ncbi:MAG: hypothetical protein AAGA85_02420 [Bacteroidota bacterium]
MRSSLMFLTLVLGIFCSAQDSPRSASDWQNILDNYRKSNHEDRLYLSTNGNYFVSGELLQFSVFCISSHSQELTGLSRVAYIALVNENKKPVVETKVLLTQGRGYGDLFLASSLPSGMYTLVAYTGLQKTLNNADFFQKAITLINPFGKGVAKTTNLTPDAGVVAAQTPPVAGVLNSFTFHDASNGSVGSAARVISDSGEVLTNFEIQGQHQSFTYIPSGDDRLVLTDTDGTNAFFEIPKASDRGIVTTIERTSKAYIITIRSPQQITADILVRSNSRFIAHESARLSGAYAMELGYQDLPQAPITLEVWQGGKRLHQLDFVHGKNNTGLSTMTNKDRYRQREEVRMTLSSTFRSFVSVVVRSKTHLSKDQEAIHELLLANYAQNGPGSAWLSEAASPPYALTDIHGDLLSGLTLDNAGNPLPGRPVFITAAAPDFHLLTARSDDLGRFVVPAPPSIQSNELLVLSDTTGVTIQMDSEWYSEYPEINSRKLQIDPADRALIEEKSLYSQVENAYYLAKVNESKPIANSIFFGAASKSYNLEDYTRFSTLEETFREIIPGIVVRKNGEDFELGILDPQARLSSENTLVLLDGLPVQNINDLMAMDALDIQKIEFVREQYFYGPLLFSGIISLQTIEGNLRGFKVSENVARYPYVPVQPPKQYHQPSYETESSDRIPDYRTVLLWVPLSETDGEEDLVFSFFTSDVAGVYEVLVEGFDREGNALLSTTEFTVE